jgi:hypothetical protein
MEPDSDLWQLHIVHRNIKATFCCITVHICCQIGDGVRSYAQVVTRRRTVCLYQTGNATVVCNRDAPYAFAPHLSGSLFNTRSSGQFRKTGSSSSVTVMVIVQLTELPLSSVTVQVTSVEPTGKVAPAKVLLFGANT